MSPDRGAIDEAIDAGEAIVKERDSTMGPSHPDTLQAKFVLAIAVRAAGDLTAAQTHFEGVLQSARLALGEDDDLVISSEHRLAEILFNLGDLKRARELQQHVLEVVSTKGDDETGPVFTGLINLANTLRDLKEFKKELPLRERLVEASTQVFRSDDPRILGIKTDLATARRETRDFKGAYELDLELLEAQRRLPAKNDVILWAMQNLALDLRGLRRMTESAELFVEIFEWSQRELDPDDPFRIGMEKYRRRVERYSRKSKQKVENI
jgi:tetratricopeptide (TPR) repeat protein